MGNLLASAASDRELLAPQDLKRRFNVIGIFPDDASAIRLVGALIAEQHDDWQTTDGRYLSRGAIAQIGRKLTKSVTTARIVLTQLPRKPPPQPATGATLRP